MTCSRARGCCCRRRRPPTTSSRCHRGGGRERPPLADRSVVPIDGRRPFRPRRSRSAQHGDAHQKVSAVVRRQRAAGCLHRDLAAVGGANRSGRSLARRCREQHARGMGEARGLLRLRVRGRRGESVAATNARAAARAATSARARTGEEGEAGTGKAPEKAEAARVREGEVARSDAASAKAADREQVTRAGSV